MRKPRVFVGTMFSNEGDYAQSCSSIISQLDVEVQHLTIVNLPEKEAHNRLWQSWRSAKSDFDFFVKIDADTVLAHNRVLFSFHEMMVADTRITGIQAPLHDFFTDGMINGLNCFSPKVTFQDTKDDLFCDRSVDVNHDLVIKANGVSKMLQPAGYHCHYATESQAFHFGLHRALKNQTSVIEKVKLAWDSNHDRLRGMALLGAKASSAFQRSGFNYADDEFKAALLTTSEQYESLIRGI